MLQQLEIPALKCLSSLSPGWVFIQNPTLPFHWESSSLPQRWESGSLCHCYTKKLMHRGHPFGAEEIWCCSSRRWSDLVSLLIAWGLDPYGYSQQKLNNGVRELLQEKPRSELYGKVTFGSLLFAVTYLLSKLMFFEAVLALKTVNADMQNTCVSKQPAFLFSDIHTSISV